MEEGWERPARVELTPQELRDLIQPAFPGAELEQQRVLASGLANTNLRFRLRGHARDYVLRLYTRDPKAATREQALMRYLDARAPGSIPLAPLLYSEPSGARVGHPYAIWAFVEGSLLQDLFKSLPARDLLEIAHECGKVAVAIAAHPFPACGELGSDLTIIKEYGPPSRFVPELIRGALFHGLAGQRLGTALRDALWSAVEQASPELAELDGRYCLVHGDYKRSNLLLSRASGSWRVNAVLDWEFAFAGPPLVDVGLFLRAGAALPSGFRAAFAAGYQAAGGELPADWLRLSRLVDLVSQMTFLQDPRDRPHVIAETTRVVEETLRLLTSATSGAPGHATARER